MSPDKNAWKMPKITHATFWGDFQTVWYARDGLPLLEVPFKVEKKARMLVMLIGQCPNSKCIKISNLQRNNQRFICSKKVINCQISHNIWLLFVVIGINKGSSGPSSRKISPKKPPIICHFGIWLWCKVHQVQY